MEARDQGPFTKREISRCARVAHRGGLIRGANPTPGRGSRSDDPPRTAEKTLQSYITRLRKGLGAGSIAREGAAYRLTVDPRAVDVARFQRLLDTGDVEAALAEWSGRPMAGLDAAGLGPAVDGLVEQWLGAVEAGLAHHVARLA